MKNNKRKEEPLLKEYVLYEMVNREYNGFLLCLTFESLIDYLDRIETEPLISHSNGTLLIDQLLIAGNGRNRYISCSFSNGKINTSSVTSVSPSEYYRELSIELLRSNYPLLHNSILTDAQKEKIKKGIPF